MFAAILAAPDLHRAVREEAAVGAGERDDEDGVRVVAVDRDRESEVGGQALGELRPVVAAVLAAVDAAVVLLVEQARLGRVCDEAVDAVPGLDIVFRQEVGADAAVDRLPALTVVGAAVEAADGDGGVDGGRVVGGGVDGVEHQPAAAGLPPLVRRVLVQGVDGAPGG